MTPSDVLETVAASRGVTVDALRGRGRGRWLSSARIEAAFQLASLGMGSCDIGRMLDRDHATVSYLVRRHPLASTLTLTNGASGG